MKFKKGDMVMLTSHARRRMNLRGLAAAGGRVMSVNGRFVTVRFHRTRFSLFPSALKLA